MTPNRSLRTDRESTADRLPAEPRAKLRAAFAMAPESLRTQVFSPEQLDALGRRLDLAPTVLQSRSDVERLPGADRLELLITGWGCPVLDEALLERLPALRYVIHSAGSVKPFVTDALWERGVHVSSQAAANAVPVAEYTVAMIVLANKGVFTMARRAQRGEPDPDIRTELAGAGNYGKVVGVIGASQVGALVLRMLAAYDLRLLVADPTLDEAGAAALGARLVPLDALVRESDVVSVHAPSLPETHGLIGTDELDAMRPGATLINTSRAELVDQDALLRVAATGRISAILDLVHVGASGRALARLDNVVVTPHLAGSVGVELHRLGAGALDEVRRATDGAPLQHPVDPRNLARSA
ncbi:hydroxyacid dehydrogenase [Glycomyces tritici]|uniref:Hydroxyacid dehydrogenase n=1 Tax=Glycomyces tritici TaxID=2665176 RepID=A0ABT7YHP0_9ACTN|nr:hydroxyacid dehydrogenase [Glycomyces tritici]MDN3238118.1 hydroxyacid dehydrogenase [Glycomyces tritici]